MLRKQFRPALSVVFCAPCFLTRPPPRPSFHGPAPPSPPGRTVASANFHTPPVTRGCRLHCRRDGAFRSNRGKGRTRNRHFLFQRVRGKTNRERQDLSQRRAHGGAREPSLRHAGARHESRSRQLRGRAYCGSRRLRETPRRIGDHRSVAGGRSKTQHAEEGPRARRRRSAGMGRAQGRGAEGRDPPTHSIGVGPRKSFVYCFLFSKSFRPANGLCVACVSSPCPVAPRFASASR